MKLLMNQWYYERVLRGSTADNGNALAGTRLVVSPLCPCKKRVCFFLGPPRCTLLT